MPIIKSAKKKLKQDKAKKEPKANNLKKAYSLLDKAAKRKIIHKNKASRLKSQLAHARKS